MLSHQPYMPQMCAVAIDSVDRALEDHTCGMTTSAHIPAGAKLVRYEHHLHLPTKILSTVQIRFCSHSPCSDPYPSKYPPLVCYIGSRLLRSQCLRRMHTINLPRRRLFSTGTWW